MLGSTSDDEPSSGSGTLPAVAFGSHHSNAQHKEAASEAAVTLICLRRFAYENALLDEVLEAKLSPTRSVAALLGPKRTLHLLLLSAAGSSSSQQGKLVEGFLINDVVRCIIFPFNKINNRKNFIAIVFIKN